MCFYAIFLLVYSHLCAHYFWRCSCWCINSVVTLFILCFHLYFDFHVAVVNFGFAENRKRLVTICPLSATRDLRIVVGDRRSAVCNSVSL